MKRLTIAMAVAGAIVLQAGAANITIKDFNSPATSYGWNGGPFNSGVYNINGEDNETEPGTIQGQIWDTEVMYTTPQSSQPNAPKYISLIGGYDFLATQSGYSPLYNATYYSGAAPGDLFIMRDTGSVGPGYEPDNVGINPSTIPSTDNVKNGLAGVPVVSGSVYANYGYTYVIQMSNPDKINQTFPVYALNSESILQTVGNDQFKSNPWKYVSGGTLIGSVKYTTFTWATDGVNDAAEIAAANAKLGIDLVANPSAWNVSMLKDDDTSSPLYQSNLSQTHELIQIDLSFYSSPENTPTWFHYTMGCGNDMLVAKTSESFYRIPDGGMSVMLLGLGLSGLGLLRRKI